MRKLSILTLLLLTTSLAWGTTPVTGTLKDLATGTVQKNAKVRAWLRGCNGNQPRVNGSALIAPTQGTSFFKDFLPDVSGNISGTLYSTRDAAGTGDGEVECGGSKQAVWYGIQLYLNGVPGPEVSVHARVGVSLDLTSVTPITVTPVVTAPTGDSTYCRLDAGNCGFTGLPSAPGVKLTEGTALTGLAGFDVIYGDSSLHRPRFINNNGAAATVALLTDNLGAFGSTTSAQLRGVISDETGSGPAVFGTAPTITNSTQDIINQPAATTFILKDNQGGTRYSIPSGGVAQSTLNNTAIGGGSTYNGTTLNKQIFTATGTHTISTGVTSEKVTICGGGGAGGGATAVNNGGGGGAGATSFKWLTGLTPGNTIAVTVGAGGTGVSAGTGNSGTASQIASGTQTITTVTAPGGVGGNANGAQSAGGAGGVQGTGADQTNAGNPGMGDWSKISGAAGGAGYFGGAATDSAGGNPGVAANANSCSGGGGAGAGANRTGGAGGSGIVIFEWTN